MSGIGPLEPGDGTTDPPEVIGSDAPRLSERWAALPLRRRRTIAALAAATALGTLIGYGCATRPEPAAPPLVPYPAQATQVTYKGHGTDPPDQATRTFTLRFALTVTKGSPVTVVKIGQPSDNLTTLVTPATPFTVPPGRTVLFTLRFHVRDCAGVPREVVLAFLDVTLRNTRAIQKESYIMGGDYSAILFKEVYTSCAT
ncbi:Tat pathway signal sequence domain protein [Actinacidiphila soli]|uniref:Tat pathway signal sequence domain protein n=1 Tax=Actinacidiphila soli TaxID=2487275 RepID=UPI0013E399EE|nr:Tat pathway signal sequence domain protein [Actinacidiphila soli]